MQVKIDDSFKVDAPIKDVWAMLSDPTRVVTCVPGAKITETIDARNYKGAVTMKIGPVVTNFSGDIEIETSNETTRELVLLGTGADTKGKGTARMRLVGMLRSLEGGGTEVSTSMEVNVVGKLAQYGSRLMEDVSRRVFVQFVECFQASVQPSEPSVLASPGALVAPSRPPEAEPVKALPLLFQAIGAAIRRFFQRLFKRG